MDLPGADSGEEFSVAGESLDADLDRDLEGSVGDMTDSGTDSVMALADAGTAASVAAGVGDWDWAGRIGDSTGAGHIGIGDSAGAGQDIGDLAGATRAGTIPIGTVTWDLLLILTLSTTMMMRGSGTTATLGTTGTTRVIRRAAIQTTILLTLSILTRRMMAPEYRKPRRKRIPRIRRA